eukprot:COSAG02_NODE_29274_length_572_cov_1.475687_1_plen_90_part_10
MNSNPYPRTKESSFFGLTPSRLTPSRLTPTRLPRDLLIFSFRSTYLTCDRYGVYTAAGVPSLYRYYVVLYLCTNPPGVSTVASSWLSSVL